jgi:hypothetical protein
VPEVNPGFEQLPDAYLLGCSLQSLCFSFFRWL